MQYLIGIIGALLAALFYSNSKRKSAESINQNVEVKEAGIKIDEQIAKNSGGIQAEEAKRQSLEEKKNEDSNKSAVDYFNSRK